MKFNIVCVKFDQKIKNLNFGLLRFFSFFKNLKNLGFFGAIFQPWSYGTLAMASTNLFM